MEDRGIGKSSLLMFSRFLAAGDLPSFNYDKYKFLVVKTFISEQLDLISLIKLIERQLSRSIGNVESLRSFFSSTWDFVQRIKIMDFGD